MHQSYFDSTKDNIIRGLSSYHLSRRADSLAVYYRDALLASNDVSIDDSLEVAKKITLTDVKDHFDSLVQNNEIFIDCLATGNVSSKSAKKMFIEACSSICDPKLIGHAKTMSYIPGKYQNIDLKYFD